MLKRKKVPTSLVNEAEGDRSAKAKREELLAAQPFEGTFGPQSSRKRCALPDLRFYFRSIRRTCLRPN